MEKAFVIKDMNSFECSSLSELDRRFLGEQSLLSALSLEQLSSSRVSNETAADGSDARPCNLAFLCLPSDPISSPQVISTNSLNNPETDNCRMTVPSQGKSSTPYMFLLKQKKAACSDQSFSDSTTFQMLWDVSLIKSESNSPKPYTESNTLESTWSPKPQSTKFSLAEVSPQYGQGFLFTQTEHGVKSQVWKDECT